MKKLLTGMLLLATASLSQAGLNATFDRLATGSRLAENADGWYASKGSLGVTVAEQSPVSPSTHSICREYGGQGWVHTSSGKTFKITKSGKLVFDIWGYVSVRNKDRQGRVQVRLGTGSTSGNQFKMNTIALALITQHGGSSNWNETIVDGLGFDRKNAGYGTPGYVHQQFTVDLDNDSIAWMTQYSSDGITWGPMKKQGSWRSASDLSAVGINAIEVEFSARQDHTSIMNISRLSVNPATVPANNGTGVVLLDKDKRVSTIVISPEANKTEKHAASELQRFIKKISGAELQIKASDTRLEIPAIYVGKNPLLKISNQLGEDGFIIKTAKQAVVLAGGSPRGTLYAVYDFLEKLGCRWYTPRFSKIPQRSTILIGKIDEIQKPAFASRDSYYHPYYGKFPKFTVRRRMNGACTKLPAKFGGYLAIEPFVHSLYLLIPKKKYFKTHPEYFAQLDGHVVNAKEPLPCMTNPKVMDIIVEKLSAIAEKFAGKVILDLSQPDGYPVFCQCKKCKPIFERTGGPSGLMLDFANRVSTRLRRNYPQAQVEFIAYHNTLDPPKNIKAAPGVIVRFCSEGVRSFAPLNKKYDSLYMKRVRGWRNVVPQVYTWEYVINFGSDWAPTPNFRQMASQLRFLQEAGASGVMAQGQIHDGGGEFGELRAWILSKLMWNPQQNLDKLVTQFMDDYYGQAGKEVKEYFDRLHEAAESSEKIDFLKPSESFLSDKFLDWALALFDRAEEKVQNNPQILKHVRAARIPVEYTAMRRGLLLERNGQMYQPSRWYATAMARLDKICAVMKAMGFNLPREWSRPRTIEYFRKRWQNEYKLVRPLKIVSLTAGELRAEILPELGGRMVGLWLDGQSKNLIHDFQGSANQSRPYIGYKDSLGRQWHGLGWNANFSVDKLSDDRSKLTLTAKLKEGLKILRTYRLAKNKNQIFISTRYFNASNKQLADSAINAIGWFDCKQLPLDKVYVLRLKGWQELDLKISPTTMYLNASQRPTGGAWMLRDPQSRLGVINRIATKSIVNGGRFRLNRWWWDGVSGLEFVGPSPKRARPLPQGASITVEHSYEIVKDYRKILEK